MLRRVKRGGGAGAGGARSPAPKRTRSLGRGRGVEAPLSQNCEVDWDAVMKATLPAEEQDAARRRDLAALAAASASGEEGLDVDVARPTALPEHVQARFWRVMNVCATFKSGVMDADDDPDTFDRRKKRLILKVPRPVRGRRRRKARRRAYNSASPARGARKKDNFSRAMARLQLALGDLTEVEQEVRDEFGGIARLAKAERVMGASAARLRGEKKKKKRPQATKKREIRKRMKERRGSISTERGCK